MIHADMDAFYVSVEQLDNPDLLGKVVAVSVNEIRGVNSKANYEARKFGIHSAMSSFLAKNRCLHLIFVPTRFDRYKEISLKIQLLFMSIPMNIQTMPMKVVIYWLFNLVLVLNKWKTLILLNINKLFIYLLNKKELRKGILVSNEIFMKIEIQESK